MTTREIRNFVRKLERNIKNVSIEKVTEKGYVYRSIMPPKKSHFVKTGEMCGKHQIRYVSAPFNALGEVVVSNSSPYRIRIREEHLGCCSSSTKTLMEYDTSDISDLAKKLSEIESMF